MKIDFFFGKTAVASTNVLTLFWNWSGREISSNKERVPCWSASNSAKSKMYVCYLEEIALIAHSLFLFCATFCMYWAAWYVQRACTSLKFKTRSQKQFFQNTRYPFLPRTQYFSNSQFWFFFWNCTDVLCITCTRLRLEQFYFAANSSLDTVQSGFHSWHFLL